MASWSVAGEASVSVEFVDNIAIVRLKAGENRLNRDMTDRLHAALDQVERNPKAVAMITTGEGKFYSNGIDLDWLKKVRDSHSTDNWLNNGLYTILDRIATFPMPTIALINGHAFAGGAVLSLAHDLRIMQTGRGWWCLNEVHIGIPFSAKLTKLFRLKLPPKQLREAAILGRRYTAEEAKMNDIVDEIASPQDLMSAGLARAKQMTKTPYNRESLRTMKTVIYADYLQCKAESQSTLSNI